MYYLNFCPYSYNLHYEQIGKEVRCIEDELPFEIPDSWEWKSWGDISFKIQYGFNAPAKQSGTIKMVRISDIQNNAVNWDTVPYCAIDNSLINDYLLNDNDILFARTGGTVGKSFLVNNINEKAIYAGYLIRTVFDHKNLNPKYLKYFMESELYWNQLKNGTIATAQPNCNGQTLSKMKLPIPPLEEQNRIILKLQKLEPLIQKYQKVEEQLYELNSSIKEHLKKSILQYAIEGKLVPQDPNDEPASILLERIQKEKQKLISEGKIKKNKNESVIYRRDNSHYEKLNGIERCIDDEIPFDIPNNWSWVRLGSLFQHNTGKALNSSNKVGTKLTYITTSNLYWDKFVLDKLKEMPFTDAEVEKCTVIKGDLLVCEGGNIGRAAIWNYDFPIRIQNHIHRLRSYIPVNVKFYYYIFYLYKHMGLIGGKGIGIQGLSSNAIHQLLFPLPPSNEQHKIVEKIEALLPFCENL